MDILFPFLYRKDAVIGNKVRYTRNGKTLYRALPGEGKEEVRNERQRRKMEKQKERQQKKAEKQKERQQKKAEKQQQKIKRRNEKQQQKLERQKGTKKPPIGVFGDFTVPTEEEIRQERELAREEYAPIIERTKEERHGGANPPVKTSLLFLDDELEDNDAYAATGKEITKVSPIGLHKNPEDEKAEFIEKMQSLHPSQMDDALELMRQMTHTETDIHFDPDTNEILSFKVGTRHAVEQKLLTFRLQGQLGHAHNHDIWHYADNENVELEYDKQGNMENMGLAGSYQKSPHTSGISTGDLKHYSGMADIKKAIVVTPTAKFTLERPPNGWNTPSNANGWKGRSIDDIEEEFFSKEFSGYNKDNPPQESKVRDYFHNLSKYYAEQTGTKYTVETRSLTSEDKKRSKFAGVHSNY